MTDLTTLGTFIAAIIVLQVTPGPDMMLVIGRGVGQGRRVALLTVVGVTFLAGLVQLPLLAFGIASLIAASPKAFDLLRFAGAAYLIWLGLKLLFWSGKSGIFATAVKNVSDAAALRQGMINNLTNPKALAFMLVFLPQFIDPAGSLPVAAQLLLLGTIQKLIGFVVLATVAIGASGIGNWLAQRPSVIVMQERFTAAILIGLGARLAFTDGRS